MTESILKVSLDAGCATSAATKQPQILQYYLTLGLGLRAHECFIWHDCVYSLYDCVPVYHNCNSWECV